MIKSLLRRTLPFVRQKIKAIIWDMDGVIISSLDYHIKTEINTFKKFGIEITPEISKEYDGLSISKYFKVISEKFKMPINIDEALKYHSHKLANFSKNEVPLFQGIIETLKELSKSYKLGLATASPKIFKDSILKKYGLNHIFSATLADEEVTQGKPHPEIYLKLAKLLGVQPGDCLVVEDSVNGIKAAQSAGMKVVAHRADHNQKSNLSIADYEVTRILDIPKILNSKL